MTPGLLITPQRKEPNVFQLRLFVTRQRAHPRPSRCHVRGHPRDGDRPLRKPRPSPSRSPHGARLFRHLGPRVVGRSHPTQVVGRPSRWPAQGVLLPGARRQRRGGDQFSRNFQRPHLGPYHGLCARALARYAPLLPRPVCRPLARRRGIESRDLPARSHRADRRRRRDWRRDRTSVQALGHDDHWHRPPR